ncbi:MAG: aspartate aminotransferase family protein [Lachnospiraceae bacterium]
MKLKDLGLTKEDIKEKVDRYMIETYERFDFVAETAKDMYIYDEEGHGYLDFFAGVAVNSAGNCNEKVVAAIQEQAADVIHTFNYPYTVPQALLAEKICSTIGMDKIFFQNSGTESNEAMIKMARKYGVEHYGPERYEIITAKKSFHGRSFGSMSATGQPDNACQIGFGDMTPGFRYADFNDLDSFREMVSEKTIAIMIEPVQGEGGIYPATAEFMQGLRKLCDEKGMLLLLDEIQTGWCRTGEVMGYMNYGIKPDIVSMAKAMGGGLPIGAICATKEVSRAFTMGSHGSTYGGNPIACAASLAQINELLDRDLAGNAKAMGEYFMNRLRSIPHVIEVRGLGLMIGAEFDDTVSGVDVKHECLEQKLLITALRQNVIRMVPPLTLTETECDLAASIIKQAVSNVSAEKTSSYRLNWQIKVSETAMQ